MKSEKSELEKRWLEAEELRVFSRNDDERTEAIRRQLEIEPKLLEMATLPPERFHKDPVLADPFEDLEFSPEDLANRSFVVIGAGVSGLCMGARLRQAGFSNFSIVEKASDLGGTWHLTEYPGLACDVPGHFYCFSFFRNPSWSSLMVPGRELQQYLADFADHYKLRNNIRFNSEVVATRFVDGKWHTEIAGGDTLVSDFVVLANGYLHKPKMADIPGLSEFAGDLMHSRDITAEYDFTGKRVGNIGMGSTSVQIVSSIVDQVKSMTVFQRTPQWIFPLLNDHYSDSRREVLARYPSLTAGMFQMHFNFNVDGICEAVINPNSPQLDEIRSTCEANLATVRDPELKAKLTPDYAPLCKRLVFSDSFYEAIQKPNSELVVDSIDRIEPAGVRTANGRLYELDTLVVSSGYDINAFWTSYDVVNSDQETLNDMWQDGIRSLNAISIAGFPNLFMTGGPHSTYGNFSIMSCAEQQSGFILRLVDAMISAGADTIQPRSEAEESFTEDLMSRMSNTTWMTGGCQSWYLNKHGGVDFWTLPIPTFIERMTSPPNTAQYKMGAKSVAAVASQPGSN